jgi:hypothetical protein
MDRIDPVALAIDWLDLYKQKNALAIAAMYAVDATMTLPGRGESDAVVAAGRPAITDHWQREFARVPQVTRELIEVYPGKDSVVLICNDEEHRRVSDFLRFDENGLIAASSCHAIPKRQQEPPQLALAGPAVPHDDLTPHTDLTPIHRAVLRCEARQTLHEARSLPVGPRRNDLRQRAVALRALSRHARQQRCDYAIG